MSKSKTLRVAIYCRVSSNQQERLGTIKAQLTALRELCKRAGYHVAGEFCDDGKSATDGEGKIEKRKAYLAVLAMVERGELDAVACVDLGRITRSKKMRVKARLLGPLQDGGVVVVTLKGITDLNDDRDEMIANIEMSGSSTEAATILRRTLGGKRELIARGGKPHGCTPYGLRYSKKENRWSVDEREAAIIREIVERVGNGESCAAIAMDFIRRKVKAPRRVWMKTSVWTLVRQARERYCGRWRVNKRTDTWIEIPHCRIVTDAAVDRADAQLIRNGYARRGLKARTVRTYMLDQKFGRCGDCGSWYGVQGNGRHRYYACRHRGTALGSERPCTAPRLQVAAVEPLFRRALEDAFASPALARTLARGLSGHDAGKDQRAAQTARAAAQKRVDAAAKKAKALAAAVDALDPDEMTAALTRLGAERKAAHAALAEAEANARTNGAPDIGPGSLPRVVAGLRKMVASATAEEWRKLVRAVCTDVVFLDGKCTAQINIPVGAMSVVAGVDPESATCSTSGLRIYAGTIEIDGRLPTRSTAGQARAGGGRFAGRGTKAA